MHTLYNFSSSCLLSSARYGYAGGGGAGNTRSYRYGREEDDDDDDGDPLDGPKSDGKFFSKNKLLARGRDNFFSRFVGHDAKKKAEHVSVEYYRGN